MDAIRLKNFRCFEDTGLVPIKPLTFLVGSNSSGKSSFLKFFPLLKQTLGQRRKGVMLWNEEKGVDFGDFKNTLKDGEKEMFFEIQINKTKSSKRISSIKQTFIPEMKISITLKMDSSRYERISKISISFSGHMIVICIDSNNEVQIYVNDNKVSISSKCIAVSTNSLLPGIRIEEKDYYADPSGSVLNSIINILKEKDIQVDVSNEIKDVLSVLVLGEMSILKRHLKKILGPNVFQLSEIIPLYYAFHIEDIIDIVNINLLNISKQIHYVQPLRSYPVRYYRFNNYEIDEISPDGSNLSMVLNSLSEKDVERFQEWTWELFQFKCKIKPTEGHLQIQISTDGETYRNIADMGFGYSQILPTLAVIWKSCTIDSTRSNYSTILSRFEQIIAIEQPELHLHPRFIRLYAIMLVRVLQYVTKKKIDLRFIIETHSEILINEIGELIANNKIESSEVNILLFNAKQEGYDNYITTATFSEDGFLTNWPYGFFSGDVY